MAFSKLFSSLSTGARKSPSTHLQPSNTNTSTTSTSTYDDYHSRNCNKVIANCPLKLQVDIESPPLVFYGQPTESSGAFFSGSLNLEISKQKEIDGGNLEPMISVSQLTKSQIENDYIVLKDVTLFLIQTTKYGKPFIPTSNTLNNCNDCTKRIVELARWDILSRKTAFAKGSSHSCPFSYIIPGSVPATTVLSNLNTSIEYELILKATYTDSKTNKDNLINLSQPIHITRSILREEDKNSSRIFPPTEVTATAVIPNVAYPRSTFPLEIRLDHVSTTKRRWKMRKLNWRFEECVCVRAHHCSDHDDRYIEVLNATKKQKKLAKINKNSSSAGHPNVNYYFETPKRQLNNNNNSITANNLPDLHPDDERNIQNRQNSQNTQNETNGETGPLAPAASNWSYTTSPVTSNNSTSNAHSNETVSNSLDQILSASIPNGNGNSNAASESATPIPITLTEPNPMYIEEIRALSVGELKSGWKSDFSGYGRIELVVEISLMNLISMAVSNQTKYKNTLNSQSPASNQSMQPNNANCSIDVDDPNLGISVTHNLIIELVVAEEMMQATMASANHSVNASRSKSSQSAHSAAAIAAGNSVRMRTNVANNNNNLSQQTSASGTIVPGAPREGDRRIGLMEDDFPDAKVGPDAATGNKSDQNNHMQGIPTGIARVLRMQFKVILSERSGVGISLDEEVPPTYHTVGPLSPPTYDSLDETSLSSLKDLVIHLDNDELNLGETETKDPDTES